MPRNPIAFISSASASLAASHDPAAAAAAAEAALAKRWEPVPEALRDALRKLPEAEAAPALAFFGMDLGGHTGVTQLVLEREEGGMQIVLKLDFDAKSWKRVRKRSK